MLPINLSFLTSQGGRCPASRSMRWGRKPLVRCRSPADSTSNKHPSIPVGEWTQHKHVNVGMTVLFILEVTCDIQYPLQHDQETTSIRMVLVTFRHSCTAHTGLVLSTFYKLDYVPIHVATSSLSFSYFTSRNIQKYGYRSSDT